MKNLPLMLSFLVMVWMMHPANARDLGTVGETYPIVETDFIEFIQQRMNILQQQGEWKRVETAMIARTDHYRDRPTPIEGLSATQIQRQFYINPGVTLDHDVFDQDHKLIAKAGTYINPLVYVPLSKALIFYNADDVKQVKWVVAKDKELNGKDKLILVKGSLLTEEKRFKKHIYFDQAGRLTSRFQIKHTPAMVMQSGMSLLVTEVRP